MIAQYDFEIEQEKIYPSKLDNSLSFYQYNYSLTNNEIASVVLLPVEVSNGYENVFSTEELETIIETILTERNDQDQIDKLITNDMVEYSENIIIEAVGKFANNFRISALRTLTKEVFNSIELIFSELVERAFSFGFNREELELLLNIVRVNKFTQDY